MKTSEESHMSEDFKYEKFPVDAEVVFVGKPKLVRNLFTGVPAWVENFVTVRVSEGVHAGLHNMYNDSVSALPVEDRVVGKKGAICWHHLADHGWVPLWYKTEL